MTRKNKSRLTRSLFVALQACIVLLWIISTTSFLEYRNAWLKWRLFDGNARLLLKIGDFDGVGSVELFDDFTQPSFEKYHVDPFTPPWEPPHIYFFDNYDSLRWVTSFPSFGATISHWYWERRSFGFGVPTITVVDEGIYSVRIPLGCVLVVTCPLSILAFRRTRPFVSSHCQECDFDLTENTSGICPECGEGTVGQVTT